MDLGMDSAWEWKHEAPEEAEAGGVTEDTTGPMVGDGRSAAAVRCIPGGGEMECGSEALDAVVLETSSANMTGFAGVYHQTGGKSKPFMAFLKNQYVG